MKKVICILVIFNLLGVKYEIDKLKIQTELFLAILNLLLW
jgi:hypothetical protein